MPNELEQPPFDSTSRSLCPDDLCLGLVGADGRCNVCGRAGTPPASAPDAPDALPSADAAATDALLAGAGSGDALAASAPGSSSDPDADPDFADRRLCPDEACIGVLGADGRCRECGKAA